MSKATNKFSHEVHARAVRMVVDHEGEHSSRWAAVSSIAAKIGCTAQTLNEWVKRAEVDSGKRAGLPSDMAEKMRDLEPIGNIPPAEAEERYYAMLDEPALAA